MTPRAKPRLRAPVGRVHVPAEHPDNPGCCTCGRPLDAKTDRHVKPEDMPAPDPETRRVTARITGDRED